MPKYCRDCKHSKPEERSEWNLKCHNPKVNSQDYYALASAGIHGGGSDCNKQRQGGFFSACGIRGKLWTAKEK